MIFAASRLVVVLAFLLAATMASVLGDDLRAGRPWPSGPAGQSPVLTALTGWDGSWYTEIARNGYGPRSGSMAFFPGFPVMVRGVAAGTGWSHATAAVVTGMVFGAVAAVLLWHLSRRLGGSEFADRSTALFAFFPGSLVFSMGYAEPLMLAAALGCMLALEHQRWALAGICGALATLTRPNAVVVVACAGVGRRGGHQKGVRVETSVGASPLAGGYRRVLRLSRAAYRLGVDVVRRRTRLWGDSFSPGSALSRAHHAFEQLAGHRPAADLNFLLPTIGVVFAVVAFVWLARWRPPATLTIFAIGVVGLAVDSANLGLRPRFLVTAFPLLQAVAWRVRGTAFAVTLAVSAAILSGLVLVTVLTLLATP